MLNALNSVRKYFNGRIVLYRLSAFLFLFCSSYTVQKRLEFNSFKKLRHLITIFYSETLVVFTLHTFIYYFILVHIKKHIYNYLFVFSYKPAFAFSKFL